MTNARPCWYMIGKNHQKGMSYRKAYDSAFFFGMQGYPQISRPEKWE